MNPADLTLATISPTLTSKTLPAAQASLLRNGKAPIPRIDLEPIYTALKSALGDGWNEYKAALNAFITGNLNQAELSYVLQPLLSTAPTIPPAYDPGRPTTSTLHLHNQLIISIFANCTRDPPPTEVAPWVVATDTTTNTTKSSGSGASGANDAAEERLKKEVLALHARDRRRLKALKGDNNYSATAGAPEALQDIQSYWSSLAVKPPSTSTDAQGTSLGSKGTWDLENRRRYALPLSSETLEFPTLSDLSSRIEPICAEEGLLVGNSQTHLQSCAELLEQATEVYLKEMLSQLWSHVRSNSEGCIQTAKFKRQLRKEEEEFERGSIQRNAAGYLPVEMEAQAQNPPLDMQDLRVGLLTGDEYLRQDLFLKSKAWLHRYPSTGSGHKTLTVRPHVNGVAVVNGDAGSGDGEETWAVRNAAHQVELQGLLEDCLAVG